MVERPRTERFYAENVSASLPCGDVRINDLGGTAKTRQRATRNPLKAIRAKCLECCGGSPKEVRLCSDVSCALHPFRSGQKPLLPRRRRSATRSDPSNAASMTGNTFKQGPKEIQLSLLPLLPENS